MCFERDNFSHAPFCFGEQAVSKCACGQLAAMCVCIFNIIKFYQLGLKGNYGTVCIVDGTALLSRDMHSHSIQFT